MNSNMRCVCMCMHVSARVTGKQQGIWSSDRWHAEGARTHQSEEQVLPCCRSCLILPDFIQHKLVSPVVHLLWPYSKKSPRVTTCEYCFFYSVLFFFSGLHNCCQGRVTRSRSGSSEVSVFLSENEPHLCQSALTKQNVYAEKCVHMICRYTSTYTHTRRTHAV